MNGERSRPNTRQPEVACVMKQPSSSCVFNFHQRAPWQPVDHRANGLRRKTGKTPTARSSPAPLRRAATASSISVTKSCFPRPSRRQSPLTCTYRTVARPFFPFRRHQGGVTPSPCLGTSPPSHPNRQNVRKLGLCPTTPPSPERLLAMMQAIGYPCLRTRQRACPRSLETFQPGG